VLKKDVEILAGLISHLVNRSLAEGCVPAAFKIGLVHPIHKGKGKPWEDPGSYRPVSILPAMSKVLESLVKGDLEGHLKRVNGLPGSQYGFCPKRSCTSALAHAQAFKIGLVHPINKGKAKLWEDPGSYRPVSILPAMSKVLEPLVKGDLEGHLKRVNGLPGSQYGFPLKRSCTSALAHAQAGWLLGAANGQAVGLKAFDLSAAFDTKAAEQLAPTLQTLGVTGWELRWFICYMTGGRHSMLWDDTVSSSTAYARGRYWGRSCLSS
jgi:hypothetical protein